MAVVLKKMKTAFSFQFSWQRFKFQKKFEIQHKRIANFQCFS